MPSHRRIHLLAVVLTVTVALLALPERLAAQQPTLPAPAAPAAPAATTADSESGGSGDAAPALAADELPADELRSLVETLEDPARREEFLGAIRRLIALQEAARAEKRPAAATTVAHRVLATFNERLTLAVTAVRGSLAAMTDTAGLERWLDRQVSSPAARQVWIDMLSVLAALLVAGWIAGRLARVVLRRVRRRGRPGRRETYLSRTLLGLVALAVAAMPILGFAVIAYLALAAAPVFLGARVSGYAIVIAIAAYQLVTLTATLLLDHDGAGEPETGRLIPIGDDAARHLRAWTRRFAMVAAVTHGAANSALALGLPQSGYFVVSRLGGLVFASLAIVFVMQNRHRVVAALRRWTGGRSRLALVRPIGETWHLLAAAYIAAVYVIWAAAIRGGPAFMLRATALTLVIALLAWVVDMAIVRLVDRMAAMRDGEDPRYPWRRGQNGRYATVLRDIVRGLVVVLAAVAVLEVWGLGMVAAFADDVGRDVMASALQIVVVIVLALFVWEFANGWIRRYLSRTGADGSLIQRSQRAKTLLPLLRTALLIVLVLVTGMTVLSELGVNIAPLLASAGVIGLAIGFGSQKLVQDVITGIFILIEDTIHVGDIVTAGAHTGEVENITIRTIRLRDLDGAVHTVPFSDVTSLVNLTKDFSYKLFEVGVAYREDTDHVTDVLIALADEMREDPEWAHVIMEPLEVMGVDRFEDSAVIIRVRLKTRPLHRWSVGREFNRRMKKRFDELGIEIPFPHRTLYFGVDREGDAPPANIRLSDAARRHQHQQQEARRAEGPTGKQQEARSGEAATGTRQQEAGSGEAATGTRQQEARSGEAATGTQQEARRAEGPTGKQQEARSGEAATGTQQEAGSGEAATGTQQEPRRAEGPTGTQQEAGSGEAATGAEQEEDPAETLGRRRRATSRGKRVHDADGN